MINLLPPDVKTSYGYAYRNTRLVRWVIAFSLSFIGLIVISTAGILWIHQTAQTYTSQITTEQNSLNQQKLPATEAQVQDISNNLQLTVKVLSQEVLFSKLLQQLATVMPSNTILTDLNIAQIQGGVDITAQATNYNTATQVQVNLAAPTNKIFTQADIENINCVTGSAISNPLTAQYPCTVTIRALFAPNNPFLFINGSNS
ncbi:MAG: PilN domain-containing protein [Candidatus Saccharimonadales bacterium]